MKRKLLFGFLLAMLLIPWPVAYAYDDGSDGVYPLTIEERDAAHAPSLKGYGNAIGSVEPGELFYIDSMNPDLDLSFILFFTNLDDMAVSFRYMNLAIGVYADDGSGGWIEVTDYGSRSSDLYLTMYTGSVEFTLNGYSRYKVTVDRGCFYAYALKPGQSVAVPEFYLSPTS